MTQLTRLARNPRTDSTPEELVIWRELRAKRFAGHKGASNNLSFPRKRESIFTKHLDSRFRGNDKFLEVPFRLSLETSAVEEHFVKML